MISRTGRPVDKSVSPYSLIGPVPPKAVDWQYCQYGRWRALYR